MKRENKKRLIEEIEKAKLVKGKELIIVIFDGDNDFILYANNGKVSIFETQNYKQDYIKILQQKEGDIKWLLLN